MNDLTQSSRAPAWCKGVLLAGMLVFAFYASTHMVAAGDTWVALACGRHFDNHGVDNVEPFSFNSHPAGPTDEQLKDWPEWTHGIIRYWHPTGWINQNWLTHLTFYKLVTWFGSEGQYNYDMLVYWKFALYVLTVFCVFGIGKTLGAGDFLSAAAACLAMMVGRSFFDIRPAGYSNLLGPAFILVLALAVFRNYKWIWLLVPLVVFWANVHGGYIYAFIMLVPFLGIHLLLLLPKRWTVSIGFVGLVSVLYLMSYKFVTHENYVRLQTFLNPNFATVSLIKNSLFAFLLVLAGISVFLAASRKGSNAAFVMYHAIGGFVFFVSLFSRFLIQIPLGVNISEQYKELFSYFVSSSQITFIALYVIGSLLILAMAYKKEHFIVLPVKGFFHTAAAGVGAFIAMVIFNPYHLTNLTHTFEISVSKHAESWRMVNEWKPAFDWMDKTTTKSNPVGEEEWFAVFCVVTGVALIVWLTAYIIQSRRVVQPTRKPAGQKTAVNTASTSFVLPKVELGILIVSLMTVYMAVQSRRFIAMAGSVAAPAVFLLIYQSWQIIAQRFTKNLQTSPIQKWKTVDCGLIALVLVGLSIFWGQKFYRTYVAPWPADNKYDSLFMRMTASHLKPFEVCDFINLNGLKGRVFNYWTEGGAVAFGETPDPKTGHIPLKLFMDGRAQAAYNHDVFLLWQSINSGGPIARDLMQEGRASSQWTSKEWQSIGQWIDKELKQRNVWVILKPKSEEDPVMTKALSKSSDWKTCYIDNTQHMLADISTQQGKQLFESILNGTAKFPDQISKSCTTATVIFENNYTQRIGDLYPLVKEAFDVFPYPTVTLLLRNVAQVPSVRQNVVADLKKYLEDFKTNKTKYQNESGYLQRLYSAQIASDFLGEAEPSNGAMYRQMFQQFLAESKGPELSRIW